MFEFVDARTVTVIFHLLGVALGAGGAFMSDGMFFKTIGDLRISATEVRFLKLGSTMVWVGLLVLFISGLVLFSFDPDKYLHSTKFLAKITIVGIITINGFIFHRIHMRRLIEQVGHPEEAVRFFSESKFLFMSGAISMVSWATTLVLGTLKLVPYSYGVIMFVYVVFVTLATLIAQIVRKRYLKKAQEAFSNRF